jgi:hypothetical protein
MQVSKNPRVVFKSNHRSINDAEKESDREHHRKGSLFRCNWLKDGVNSRCELAGLACQVSLEKFHRIAILNINAIIARRKERKEAVSIRIIWPCWESLSLFSANGGAEAVTSCGI